MSTISSGFITNYPPAPPLSPVPHILTDTSDASAGILSAADTHPASANAAYDILSATITSQASPSG